MHSQFSSDGEFEVARIVERCIGQGIDIFSITDHNSVKGINPAISLIRENQPDFIPGIEIDCNYEGIDLHVLGYNIDWNSADFLKLEEDISSRIMDSFGQMMVNLNQLGFVIDTASVLARAKGKLPTGELIAEVMLSDEKYDSPLLAPYRKDGERGDMPYINFYLDYFAQGKLAFVPIEYMSYADTIQMIRDNGGTPVVAHPGLNLKGRENTVEELLEKGAEGLEVFNNYHDMEQINYFASVVQKRNGLMTCGSDFHGKTKPLIQIGQFKFDDRFEEYLKSSILQLKIIV
ncbi:MAG: PHP domain-containing protein [Bacteroidales bacterium]|nr:PHP domain-containing protein [Bacteroidales bacterium]